MRNENNVNYLFRSLLLDYAKRLSVYGPVLGSAKKQNLYADAFDRLVAPTGAARAPCFLVWYFDQLQDQLRDVQAQLKQEGAERNVLRLSAISALMVAASAFAYFISAVFCFLLISIEASIRTIAEGRRLQQPIQSGPQASASGSGARLVG
jgi:hypothetical protein